MLAHEFSVDSPTAGSTPDMTATTDSSSPLIAMLWSAILAVAAVGGSLALTCVAPFAAFADAPL